jgi:hypothetical protein
MNRPRLWICSAAALAALWITFRVLDADAAPRPAMRYLQETVDDLPDPALEAMIDRLAVAAEQSHHSR